MAEEMVLASKRLGFSIAEIRDMTVGEVLTYIDLAMPPDSPESKKPKARKATQADIDRFLS